MFDFLWNIYICIIDISNEVILERSSSVNLFVFHSLSQFCHIFYFCCFYLTCPYNVIKLLRCIADYPSTFLSFHLFLNEYLFVALSICLLALFLICQLFRFHGHFVHGVLHMSSNQHYSWFIKELWHGSNLMCIVCINIISFLSIMFPGRHVKIITYLEIILMVQQKKH